MDLQNDRNICRKDIYSGADSIKKWVSTAKKLAVKLEIPTELFRVSEEKVVKVLITANNVKCKKLYWGSRNWKILVYMLNLNNRDVREYTN